MPSLTLMLNKFMDTLQNFSGLQEHLLSGAAICFTPILRQKKKDLKKVFFRRTTYVASQMRPITAIPAGSFPHENVSKLVSPLN